MLKKAICSLAVCGVVLVAGFGTADASIPKSEVCLGGVQTPKSRRGDIIQMYGAPTREGDYGTTLYYGDSVVIGLMEGSACTVTVTRNNGWRTPSGLAVGMTADEAIAMYGDPDQSEVQGNKKIYIYYVEPLKQGRGHLGVVFDRDSKKITKLNVYRNTMADFKNYFPNWLKNMLS